MDRMLKYMVAVGLVGMVLLTASCRKFLDVAPPASVVPNELVFADDAAATSAVIGMYINLNNGSGFAGGHSKSFLLLAGLSADELVNVPKHDRQYLDFEQNNISPLNENVLSLWSSLYKAIYAANSILEGLSASTGITTLTKERLRGEALFMRGFCYFYLTNMFGNVPLVLSTDYKVNARLAKSPVVDVYKQIKDDLSIAESLLPIEYLDAERTRVNRYAVSALLSRVYLYSGDWARAEDKATKVIDNTIQYNLSSLHDVFLANSTEAIWQLRPLSQDPVANEANMFGFYSAISLNSLNGSIVDVFETGDQRLSAWIAGFPYNNTTIYLPVKYKRDQIGSALPKEYSMVMRLGEMYLVRAEARLHQDRLSAAVADVDKIRTRAGLPRMQDTNPGISADSLMLCIEKERRIELLAEWGHRWLDLKRWNRSMAVLSVVKPGFTANDQLYPIPEDELNKNQQLKPQNLGY